MPQSFATAFGLAAVLCATASVGLLCPGRVGGTLGPISFGRWKCVQTLGQNKKVTKSHSGLGDFFVSSRFTMTSILPQQGTKGCCNLKAEVDPSPARPAEAE